MRPTGISAGASCRTFQPLSPSPSGIVARMLRREAGAAIGSASSREGSDSGGLHQAPSNSQTEVTPMRTQRTTHDGSPQPMSPGAHEPISGEQEIAPGDDRL